jgi:hypothetical protein
MAGARNPVKSDAERKGGASGGVYAASGRVIRRARMRSVVLAAAVAVLACVSGDAMAQGAWCAEDMNARNCGFHTREQCLAAASGLGADCYPSPFAATAPPAEPRKRSKRATQSR